MDFIEFKKRFQIIESNTKLVKTTPLVSVCVTAFNQEKYIKFCLDSILSQVTTFPFEIFLGEDASIDGTREICKEYTEKYPDKISLVLHHRENNIEIKGRPTGRFNFIYNLFLARGKYIALCEGDDFWIDNNKLQKQVDFLKSNDDFIACGHSAVVMQDGKILDSQIGKYPNAVFTDQDFSRGYKRIPTASLMFKNVIEDIPSYFTKVYGGDRALLYLLSKKGKIKVMDFAGSVYRMHDQSLEANYRNNRAHKRNLAWRNIEENGIYLQMVDSNFKSALAKKIRWNYFYLFFLNIKEIKLLDAIALIPALLRFQLVVMGIHKVIPKN